MGFVMLPAMASTVWACVAAHGRASSRATLVLLRMGPRVPWDQRSPLLLTTASVVMWTSSPARHRMKGELTASLVPRIGQEAAVV